MGAVVGIVRFLITSLAGYGGWRWAEATLAGPDVQVNTSGPVSTVADKLGIPKSLAWLVIAIAALLALRYFFKSKSI